MLLPGVEVKAGQPLKVNPEVGSVIHISQAALGEGKKGKGNDIVPLWVNINGKKLVLGSLSAEKFPQVSFDLVFEKEFELSHDWKDGSVYFCGYSADNQFEYPLCLFLVSCAVDFSFAVINVFISIFNEDDSSEDEDIRRLITENGKDESKGEEAKPAASKGKAAKLPKVMMDASDDSDSEDEDDTDEEDDEEEEDEETPQKAELSKKKRPTESVSKTPVPAKKAKLDTPQKTDGKKGGGHTATPHPAKQAGKTPNTSEKSKEKTPKSDSKVSCKSCSKSVMMDASDDSDSEDEDDTDEEDDEEEEDEETPKKAELSKKKRPTESVSKTPVPAKKAKLDTPQKTGNLPAACLAAQAVRMPCRAAHAAGMPGRLHAWPPRPCACHAVLPTPRACQAGCMPGRPGRAHAMPCCPCRAHARPPTPARMPRHAAQGRAQAAQGRAQAAQGRAQAAQGRAQAAQGRAQAAQGRPRPPKAAVQAAQGRGRAAPGRSPGRGRAAVHVTQGRSPGRAQHGAYLPLPCPGQGRCPPLVIAC
ncbi:hypothetical protein TEA_007818 [Camellia sinensis var. sinensis]|uniref:Nucleoplasmin-like domain-containing protein n=1 Tax=Camellia sinensis var. sinensis TaxID=542762 RepID=A0A4S4DBF9_CAMSN|nr:hypothetical protein TEA_007818 [Camellia sinensis var. sinensis]